MVENMTHIKPNLTNLQSPPKITTKKCTYVEEGNIFPTYLEGRDAPSPPIVSRKVA